MDKVYMELQMLNIIESITLYLIEYKDNPIEKCVQKALKDIKKQHLKLSILRIQMSVRER